jgi:hypothetical protein
MASARKKNKEEEKIELVFYGTSVSKNALWIENYDFLQFKMCDLFENWSQVRKVSHFVHKNISEEELNDQTGLEYIQADKYEFLNNKIYQETLTSYLLDKEDKKFDVVFWIDGGNLVDIFLDTKEIRTLFDSDIRLLFKKIKDFYNALKPGAVLVNLVYHEQSETTRFCGFEDFYDYPGIWCMDTFLFLVNVLNRLFEKLEPGVYQKKSVENLDEMIQELYHSTMEDLFNLGVEYFEDKEKMVEAVDHKYFGGKLKSADFQIERPIMNCMCCLVEETVKSSQMQEEGK